MFLQATICQWTRAVVSNPSDSADWWRWHDGDGGGKDGFKHMCVHHFYNCSLVDACMHRLTHHFGSPVLNRLRPSTRPQRLETPEPRYHIWAAKIQVNTKWQKKMLLFFFAAEISESCMKLQKHFNQESLPFLTLIPTHQYNSPAIGIQ